MKNKNEREIALQALNEIIDDKGYNNITLRNILRKSGLSDIQKSAVTETVNGTIRNLIFIDYIINIFSKTKTKKMKMYILNLMRMSIYQIMFMDKTPDSAVCNEAVNIVKKTRYLNLSGYVNGTLRNIVRNKEKISFPDKKDIKDYLSVMYSYPMWLVEKFINDFGIEKTEEIFKINNTAPSVSIAVNTVKTSKDELKEILTSEKVNIQESKIIDNAFDISGFSDITELNSFESGLFHVMDESAMLPVYALEPKENETILDVCAAPGGKSFLAAYLMNDKGKIISRDIFSHKIDLIKESVKRLNINIIECQIKDGSIIDEKDELYGKVDKVLVDAPCSGLGLIRRRPDIKYTKTYDDVLELSKLQKKILESASKYVKKDGILVYSTCTLTKEENQQNVKWFTDNFPFRLDKINYKLSKPVKPNNKGCFTVLPTDYSTDGFFIAKLKRID